MSNAKQKIEFINLPRRLRSQGIESRNQGLLARLKPWSLLSKREFGGGGGGQRGFPLRRSILGLALMLTVLGGSLEASVNFGDNRIAEIVDSSASSVVNILVHSNQQRQMQIPFRNGIFHFFAPGIRTPQRRGEGSGVIYDSSGLILTNHHVVKGADKITVTLSDGRKLSAVIEAENPESDLALLKLKDPMFSGSLEPKFVAKLGNSDRLRVGEWVIAIGSPFSLDGTVTAGIVSARGRNLNLGPQARYNNLIQTDASINPGNSGGPLLNLEGEVIAINTAINPQGQGLGFAIPINLAKRMIGDVSRFGRIQHSWLGVRVQDVKQELLPYLGLDSPHGALVELVIVDTPAARAGLKPRDVILEIDGQKVRNKDILIQKIQEIPAGKEVLLKIQRQGSPMDLRVTLEVRGKASA
jgi:serine protease Do